MPKANEVIKCRSARKGTKTLYTHNPKLKGRKTKLTKPNQESMEKNEDSNELLEDFTTDESNSSRNSEGIDKEDSKSELPKNNDVEETNESSQVSDKNISDKTQTDSVQNNQSSLGKERDVLRLSLLDDCTAIHEEFNSEQSSSELFNSIFNGTLIPQLPSKSWAMHCVDLPERCIVISEMIVQNEPLVGLIPIYVKQIVFDQRMNYDLFLLNSRAVIKKKPCIVRAFEDFMHVIDYTNELKVCMGGPEVSTYGHLNLECAYKDPKQRYRHNLCSLEVTEGDICESCVSLEEILVRSMQRNKSSVKLKSLHNSSKRKRLY
ncbi:uncharacterized protein [Prorops nasuta]|uniref:uncharacterized protein isoform X2 n=1 Tax=Prorops nasuta TaxID=863751 RepID=UPI0034CD4A17